MAGRGERIRLTGVKYIHIQYLTDIILRANIYLIKELPLLVGRQVPKLGKTALQKAVSLFSAHNAQGNNSYNYQTELKQSVICNHKTSPPFSGMVNRTAKRQLQYKFSIIANIYHLSSMTYLPPYII